MQDIELLVLARDRFHELRESKGICVLLLRMITIVLLLHFYTTTDLPSFQQELQRSNEWRAVKTPLPVITFESNNNASKPNGTDKERIQQETNDYQSLLSVPFYIYDDLLWCENATIGGNITFTQSMKIYFPKHTDDYWFSKAALSHPMRTHDPTKAKLYIVPTLLNALSDQLLFFKKRFCVNGICNENFLRFVDKYLADSPWYQRNEGRDHIMVASHWGAHEVLRDLRHVKNCNFIGYENIRCNNRDRLTIPKIMVGSPCQLETSKSKDVAMIASMQNITTFESRWKICQWVQASNYTVSACGSGNQCPALARAKYGFHARGDTFGSNRLFDTILSGTVPIFTFREQYDILPSFIDWEAFSEFADVRSRKAFLSDLKSFMTDTNDGVKKYSGKLAMLTKNVDLVDWTTPIPFDTYMYVFARAILPSHQPKKNSKFSALRLNVVEKWLKT